MKLSKISLFTSTLIVSSVLFTPISSFASEINPVHTITPRAHITGGGGALRPQTSKILYLSKYELEKYYGKKFTSGSSTADYIVSALIGVKNAQLGFFTGLTFAMVDEAVNRRASTLNNIKNNILYKGARGIKLSMKGKPSGYPVLSITFDTWW
ncbi:hypothetical protein K5V21_13700 [Clostridium sardiniense]|uniref:Uncharacterized protein n=1 Tax=Clostridium sardiniense TaxID=29369 RepID=A0ABS7L0A9_CLOSR|nr:hypothetical protein [Clostridium sardiniense]MBY0756500.1 hypothetical protein [Clostridium sardiniense]MDQ0460246.1 hypothetical protein [Clostridium sardiniense]